MGRGRPRCAYERPRLGGRRHEGLWLGGRAGGYAAPAGETTRPLAGGSDDRAARRGRGRPRCAYASLLPLSTTCRSAAGRSLRRRRAPGLGCRDGGADEGDDLEHISAGGSQNTK